MEIVKYQNGDHALLRKLADNLGQPHGLRYPEFVDYYYAGSEWCSLYLAVDNDEVVAVLGLEQLNFATAEREINIGFGSNFTSFRPGAGGVLLRHWLKTCDLGMMFGGNEETHKMFRRLRWTFYPNIREFHFNGVYRSYSGDSWWKRLAKAVLRLIGPKASVAERAR